MTQSVSGDSGAEGPWDSVTRNGRLWRIVAGIVVWRDRLSRGFDRHGSSAQSKVNPAQLARAAEEKAAASPKQTSKGC